MKIVLTGGGSGGHITPLLAVAHQLKALRPDVELIYIGQRGDSLSDVAAQHPDIDAAYTVRAGKFRRYHGEGLKQALDVPTIAKNARDSGRVVVGLAESRRLLKKLQPDVIFIKGGFVGVPVGLAAALAHVPFVTHDSDAIPGLANRIIARWATAHAVALPKEAYSGYPPDKTFTVGVPIDEHFQPVTPSIQQAYLAQLGLSGAAPVIFVTGGGNGARQLNRAVATIAPELLEAYPHLRILHLAGRAFASETHALYEKHLSKEQLERVILKDFVHDLYRYSGAADVVIGRGSATNLAEFAIQAKACIMVPARQLIWTVKNTTTLAERGAVVAITEEELQVDPGRLAVRCKELLDSPAKRAELGQALSETLAHPQAARELAQLLLKTVS